MNKKEKIILPGEEIGTEEEYIGGDGTYTQNSKIYASIVGKRIEDNRTLSIEPMNNNARIVGLTEGMKIIGRIENIVDPIAIVSLIKVDEKNIGRIANSGERAILHASYIKKGYVKKVKDELSIGDIIRAKIIGLKKGEYQLSTEDEDCGCIKAYSALGKRCALEKNATGLTCKDSDIKENRKIAKDYRKIQI